MIPIKAAIKRRVDQLLTGANISQPAVDVNTIAQSIGLQIQYIAADDDISGCLVRRDGHAVIGINPTQHPNRQRFTIAHELGHYFLHKGRPYYVDRTPSFTINFRGSGLNGPEEREANAFAAELLMPEEFVLADIEARIYDLTDDNLLPDLAKRYEVSVPALTYRLANLGLLPA